MPKRRTGSHDLQLFQAGDVVAVCGTAGSDAEQQWRRRVFLHTASNGAAVREFGGSPDYVYRAAVTPDGTIVAAGCEDGVLRIWNGVDGKEIAKFPAD